MAFALRLAVLGALLLALPFTALGGEYDFTIPEVEKSNLEFGGKIEFRHIYHQLDKNAAAYQLRFPDADREDTSEWLPLLEWSAGYNLENVRFFLRVQHQYQKTYQGEEWFHRVQEGYMTLRPNPGLSFDIGKKSYLWGKGYAWNPAGFINRPKDPDDPELSLEGYTALSMDWIRSFPGNALQTVAVTPVILPVMDFENEELGRQGDVHYALKAYFLLADTDLDFIFSGGPDQPNRFGMDFSRNVRENLEIHGEAALAADAERIILNAAGGTDRRVEDQWSWLLGLRYLNQYDTTFILEYYHNGAGYSPSETEDFFAFQEAAYRNYLAGGNRSALSNAAQKANLYYRQRNYGRDYLYLKISQKEPFDILYFTPYVTLIAGLEDASFSLSPGLAWQPWTNVELGWKVVIPCGPDGTEFGEKADDYRTEFLMRHYF